MGWHTKPNKRERGQALTEMALTLPILLLVILGIMDFGRMVFLYSQIANAAREGARYGSVVGVFDSGAGEVEQVRDCAAIRAAVREMYGLPVTITDEQIDITYDDGNSSLGLTCNGTYGPTLDQIPQGSRILVEVESTFEFITPVISAFVPSLDVSFKAARTILIGGTQVPPCCY